MNNYAKRSGSMSEKDEVIGELVDALRAIMVGIDPECGEPDCMECRPWRQARYAIAKAAIAADRAARAEPIAWATPAGIAAIHAARLGRADNVQVPLSTYPGGDHSVAVYTAPPAAPVVPQDISPANVPMYWRDESSNACAYAAGWNACRTTMLAAPAPSQEHDAIAAAVKAERERIYALIDSSPEHIWRDAGFAQWRERRAKEQQ